MGRRSPGRVEALRAVKDRAEIEAIREAIGHAERAFAMLRAGLRPGDSEKDAADALEGYLRRCGASAAASRRSSPSARGRPCRTPGRRPEAGSATPTSSWSTGGRPAGPYKSDLTRVMVTGKVTPKFEKVYRTVLAAQERGIAAIRPGATAEDVDAEARSVIEEAGFGRFFDHGLGHGLGLDIHESPFFRRDNPATLQAGMVVTVEPGIYLPDWGGIRIEDDVLVTPDGPEVLTRVPRSLDSVLAPLTDPDPNRSESRTTVPIARSAPDRPLERRRRHAGAGEDREDRPRPSPPKSGPSASSSA